MNRFHLTSGLALFFAAAAALCATATSEQCASLAEAYEAQIQSIGSEEAADFLTGDKTKQIARNTRQSVYASLAQANLTMLVANGCPVPTAPARVNTYLGAAMECHDAIGKAVAAKPTAHPVGPPSCARSSWKRSPGR